MAKKVNSELQHAISIIFCIGLWFAPAAVATEITDQETVSGNAATTEIINVDNFSNQLVLVKQESYYQFQNNGLKVELSNRLIVKTVSNISKQDLYRYHQQIDKVKLLFSGKQFQYYLLKLKSEDLLAEVLNKLQKLPFIELVQPDILQLNTKAQVRGFSNPAVTNNYSPYINLLNIQSLWSKTTGKGVKVAIIDDGFNLNHADLQHIKPAFSYDVETATLLSTPQPIIDGHGTKVAGIIFAAHNDIGIDGIAPQAEFIALRQPDTWTSNTLLSFQLAKLAGASIINCSWHSQILLQPVADVVDELAKHGRDDKGIAVIFAAGNQGKVIRPGSSESAIDSAIVVAANDGKFTKLGYSNYGQTVDIFTYGKRVKTTLVSGKYGVFSGTSLAAAIVSGLSALLLSEHPNLSLAQLSQQLKLLTATP